MAYGIFEIDGGGAATGSNLGAGMVDIDGGLLQQAGVYDNAYWHSGFGTVDNSDTYRQTGLINSYGDWQDENALWTFAYEAGYNDGYAYGYSYGYGVGYSEGQLYPADGIWVSGSLQGNGIWDGSGYSSTGVYDGTTAFSLGIYDGTTVFDSGILYWDGSAYVRAETGTFLAGTFNAYGIIYDNSGTPQYASDGTLSQIDGYNSYGIIWEYQGAPSYAQFGIVYPIDTDGVISHGYMGTGIMDGGQAYPTGVWDGNQYYEYGICGIWAGNPYVSTTGTIDASNNYQEFGICSNDGYHADGALQGSTYATIDAIEAVGAASQLATDTAAVEEAVGDITTTITILGVTGQLDMSSIADEAAQAQLADDTAAIEAAKASIVAPTAILGVTGTYTPETIATPEIDTVTAYIFTVDGEGHTETGQPVFVQMVDAPAGYGQAWDDVISTLTSNSDGMAAATMVKGGTYLYWRGYATPSIVTIPDNAPDPYTLESIKSL